jgi:Protein-tyrosine phosphatase
LCFQAKCEKYWPDVQQTEKFGAFGVKNARVEVFSDFIIRELWVHSDDGNKRKVDDLKIFERM